MKDTITEQIVELSPTSRKQAAALILKQSDGKISFGELLDDFVLLQGN